MKRKNNSVQEVQKAYSRGNQGALPKGRVASERHFSSGSSSATDAVQRVWEPVQRSPRKLLCLILVLGIFISLSVHFSHLIYWHEHRDTFYYDEGIPLMTTLDAYFYLRLTSEYLNGQYNVTDEKRPAAARPFPVPLLVSLTATLHRITHFSLEHIAFYLPPLLASLMVLVYVLWGFALESPLTALIASVAGTSSVYWYTRTFLGRFDTDSLNPFFAFLIVFMVYRFCSTPGYKRFIYPALSFVLAYAFNLWWSQVQYFGIFFIVSSYTLSFFLPSSKVEKYIKIALFTGGVIAAVALVSGLYRFFPDSVAHYFTQGAGYLKLISKKTATLFPEVGQSIQELETDSLADLAIKVSGHVVTFALSLVGLFFMFKRKWEVALFLVPILGVGLLTLVSRRFLIFLTPLCALGIGYFLAEVIFKNRHIREIPNPLLRYGLFVFILGLFFGNGLYLCLSTQPRPSVTVGQVALARAVQENSPEKMVWAWWDYGYFLQYMTGKKTFTDGGSQSPDRIFVTAFPMTCQDPVLAGNWIRFFTAHDVKGLYKLSSQLGGIQKAVEFLKEALAKPEKLESLLPVYGLQDVAQWKKYLFPADKAFLYLSTDLIDKAYWWYYFGSWDFKSGEGIHPTTFKIGTHEGWVDEQEGVIKMRTGNVPVGRVINVGASDVQVKDLNPNIRTAAMWIRETSSVYALDGSLLETLAFDLLFQRPQNTPGFVALEHVPDQGGVWRVE